MCVYSAVLSPFAIYISAKAEHFFRIIQESRSPAIEKMKAMVSQDQIAILKYYLKLLAQTKARRSTQSMQNKEKYSIISLHKRVCSISVDSGEGCGWRGQKQYRWQMGLFVCCELL